MLRPEAQSATSTRSAGCGGPAHPQIDVGERQTRLREKYVGPRDSCPMPAIKSAAISRLMKRLYGLDPSNKVIAQRIIEGARAGVRYPNALCEMAGKDLVVP